MSDFTFEMDIHQEGIILVKLEGIFDFDVWRAKRQAVLDTNLSGVNLAGRPSIVDLRASEPPADNWRKTFVEMHRELRRVGEGTGPIAVILGNNPMKAVTARLYQVIISIDTGEDSNVIVFSTYDEAFRWVMENDGWRDDIG